MKVSVQQRNHNLFLHDRRRRTRTYNGHFLPYRATFRYKNIPSDKLVPAMPEIAIETPGMEKESLLLDSFTKIPSISKASMFDTENATRVSMEVSQRDVPANTTRKSLVHFLLDDQTLQEGKAETFLSPLMENIVYMAPSPSGDKSFVVKKENDKKSVVLQIYNRMSLEFEVVVPEKLHGPVVNDGWFGIGASWSKDERFVAYTAERAKSKQTPEWGGLANDSDDNTSDADPKGKTWRGVGEFEEDWGELNTGKRSPAVFVFDVVTRGITLGALPDDHCSYGQPVWAPDGEHLTYVCWENESSVFPRMKQKLGIVYCFNRHCVIKCCKWPHVQEAKVLTPEHRSAFSPRFSSNGDLFFMSQDNAVRSGTHNATPSLHSLCRKDFLSGMEETDVPKTTCLVQTKNFKDSTEEFPGLYTTILPQNSIVEVGNRRYVWATVQWRSDLAVIAVDAESGQVIRASPDNGSSWSLLGITQRSILVIESNPACPAKLHAVQFAGKEQNLGDLKWTSIMVPDLQSYPENVIKSLSSIQHKTLRVEAHDSNKNAINSFEATVIHSGEAKPTLLMPHGGPHSAYSSQFVMTISYLVASGYNIITVNYRGSTGFGEDFVQSLPGNIGDQDVKDCYQALLRAKDEGLVIEEQVGVVGGSHGGFLSSHLIGQYPDVFKAAILRNPVCNISLMVHLTDIPDWCFIETYGSDEGLKRAQTCVSMEDLLDMESKSPVKYVGNVKTPVLMMLGGGDRRVPMDDGKRYIARLKQRHDSPESRLIVFDTDDHGLTKPQTEFEQWITALWWLKKFIHD